MLLQAVFLSTKPCLHAAHLHVSQSRELILQVGLVRLCSDPLGMQGLEVVLEQRILLVALPELVVQSPHLHSWWARSALIQDAPNL